ncbi:MAG TPA: hypothetical protein VNJ08_03890 [Bacteriovoracaceae bacterium]|nr:hypothetical protein [Bacteriovoracaceae bacterium]
MEGLKYYFLKEARPFVAKREFNWSKLQFVGLGVLGIVVLAIVIWPASKPDQATFHEKAEAGSLNQIRQAENDPTQEAIKQLQESQANMNQVHGSIDHLYKPSTATGFGGAAAGGKDRNSAMILSRSGVDSRTQLSSGTKLMIRLSGKTIIANGSMPVVGIVSSDVASESGTAIPSGSKVLGDASFDADSEQASINWRSIILADGRERPFSAISQGRDGQMGIDGNVHSDGVKNAVGQTLTRFVGAYAGGSMNTGAFGANQGGNANGFRNAIAQTATDRANVMSENMQKERKWIELASGTETVAILSQPFSFRDAGATYGN